MPPIVEPSDPEDPAPTYQPVEATKPTYKKYGYNPKPTNPTIWRQQVMKVGIRFSSIIELNNLTQTHLEGQETST